MTATPTLLILAGKRDGALDPLAEKAGVSHKCRVPIAGKPLLQWVLEAVGPAFPDAPIFVSIHDPQVIADIPAVAALTAAGRLTVIPAEAGILESLEAAVSASGSRFPLLITTGDNVNVTAAMLREAHAVGASSGASALPVLARKPDILSEHPEAQRNFYDFSDVSFGNCNMYWLADADALKAAEAFRGGGQFAKRRRRMAKAFGIINVLRFRRGRWTFDQALKAISRRFGVPVKAHFAPGRFAVDVDNQRTYDIAELLLHRYKSDDISAEVKAAYTPIDG